MNGKYSRLPVRIPNRCLLLAACLMITSCGLIQKVGLAPKPPAIPMSEQPFSFKLIISATDSINPDTAGRPSPVRVRIFLTAPDSDLTALPFEEIFEFVGEMDPQPVATVMLKPGKTEVLKVAGMRSQRILSIAAAFRDPLQTKWIESKTVDTMSINEIAATVSELLVEIN